MSQLVSELILYIVPWNFIVQYKYSHDTYKMKIRIPPPLGISTNWGIQSIVYPLVNSQFEPGSHRGWKIRFHEKFVTFRVYVNLVDGLNPSAKIFGKNIPNTKICGKS